MADNHRVSPSYDYNAICDVCGFKFKASKLRKRWDGVMVCEADYETRHISDFFATRNDTHTLPFIRTKEGTVAYPELGTVTTTSAGVTSISTGSIISGAQSATMAFNCNNITNLCIEAWIKPSALDNKRCAIVSTAGGNDNGSFCLEVGGTTVQGFTNCLIFGYVAGGSYSAYCRSIDNAIKIGQWQHVAYSRFGNAQYLYVNGVPVATVNTTIPPTILSNTTAGALLIGRRTSSLSSFAGAIRDVRIWVYGKTQNEIQRSMNDMNLLVGDGNGTSYYLTGFWKMNEGSGSTIRDTCVVDPSHLTISGSGDFTWNYDYR